MSKWQFRFASCEGASLCVPPSPPIFRFQNILWIVRECVCQGKVLQRKGIYWEDCLLRHGDCYHPPPGKKKRNGKKNPNILPSILFLLLILYLALPLFGSLPLSFCIIYKGSCFLQNEATCGRYANEIIARGLEWDTIYPKSWLSIMAGD